MKTGGQKKELSILLPVYNEASQIQKCIRELKAVLNLLSLSYEIMVSEDGSTDGTDVIVRNMSSLDSSIRLLHSSIRLGKGQAIKKAAGQVEGNIVIFMDADLAANLKFLPKLLRSVQDYGGLAIASRHVEDSAVRRRASRTFFSLAYNLFVRLLFFDGVHDHQCGFKAMSKNAARVALETKSDGFFFDTELILRCKRQGFSVREIGVEWTENRGKGASKVRLFRDAQQIGLDLLRYRFSL